MCASLCARETEFVVMPYVYLHNPYAYGKLYAYGSLSFVVDVVVVALAEDEAKGGENRGRFGFHISYHIISVYNV